MPANASYDYARLIAAFGIVVFHAQAPGAQIGYAALPFFLMLMILFALPGAARHNWADYLRGRWRRLMRPFLIWSALYAGLKLAEVALTGATLASEFAPHMLLTGPAIHLWFLPFAFVTCLAVYPLARCRQRPLPWALGLAGLALMFQAAGQGQSFTPPLAQWAYVAPAACLGMGLALLTRQPRLQAMLALGVMALATLLGWGSGLAQLALASAALLTCGMIHLPPRRGATLTARASMGVYLAHPLVFSLLERTTPITKTSLAFALVAGLLALALTLLWPRLPAALRAQLRQTALN